MWAGWVWQQRQWGLRRCKHVKGFVFFGWGGSRKRIVYVKSRYLLLEVLFDRCVHANVDEREFVTYDYLSLFQSVHITSQVWTPFYEYQVTSFPRGHICLRMYSFEGIPSH